MKKDMLRVAAQERGESTYTPEKPCAKNHQLRHTRDGSCIACKTIQERTRIAQDRERYNQRKTAERFPHKQKLAEKAAAVRASESVASRLARLETARIKQVQWRLNNPNHENTKLVKARWKKENPGVVHAHTIKRRISKRNRMPKWITPDEHWLIEQAYVLAQLRTKLFGFSWHVDHIFPLQGKLVSGLHVPENLQVIPGVENVRKSNTYTPA